MSEDPYVTNDAWVRQIGRPDLIDEVADQFERPVADGVAVDDTTPRSRVESAWIEPRHRWPRTPRGWRSLDLFARHGQERRVG